MLDVSGKRIFVQDNPPSVYGIDIHTFMPGIYILKAYSGKEISFRKITIMRR
jgi:hypothetical protein